MGRSVLSGLRLKRRRPQQGAVAIEFALISIPFIIMIIGTIEVSFMFFRSAMLEGATGDAARFIRVGGGESSPDPLQEFQDRLCDQLVTINCDDLMYEAIPYPQFTDALVAEDAEYNEDGELVSRGFDPGGSSDVIVVQVAYRHTFFTPLLGTLVNGTINQGVTLTSFAIFENEPWDG